jgi:hypothetical protein
MYFELSSLGSDDHDLEGSMASGIAMSCISSIEACIMMREVPRSMSLHSHTRYSRCVSKDGVVDM